MEISFRGQYDKELFFKSVRLANRPPKNRRFVPTFMLVFIMVAIGVLVLRLLETGDILGNATYIVLIMIIGAFLVRSYLQPYLAAREMWANPSVRRKLAGVVTKKGIVYQLEEGNNEISWERFLRVRKARNLTTLTTREGLLVIFPQHFFKNDTNWQRFNSLVDSKVVSIK
jgi:hypothetical protein